MGSELRETDLPDNPVLWSDLSQIGLGQIGKMALSPDGETPLPPLGVNLYPSAVLQRSYGEVLKLTAEQLIPRGVSLIPFPWDWRKEISRAGEALAERISLDNDEPGSVGIIAHSAGGLVSRIAYMLLVSSGRADLISRILTYGTPHYGSYGIVDAWSDNSESIDQLYWLINIGFGFASIAPGVAGIPWSTDGIIGLTQTWPAFYETLPQLSGSDANTDPNRELIFDSQNWPADRRPSQAWLTHSRDTWNSRINNPDAIPPIQVLSCLVGLGAPTSTRLINKNGLIRKSGLEQGPGDGQVAETAGYIHGQGYWYVTSRHHDLPWVATAGTIMTDLLFEDKGTIPPPPSGGKIDGKNAPLMQAPPIGGFFGRECGPGGCTC